MKLTYITVGKDTSGRNAQLSPVAANWWRLFVQVVRAELGVELEIIQAKGTYSGSGGTHADGWSIDLRTWRFGMATIRAIVAIARRFGASATWYRVNVGSGPHIHLVVDAGPTKWTAPTYQTTAVKAGYNGLGAAGKSGKDTHPKPDRWITGAQGIAAMQAHLKITPNQQPPTQGGLTMSDIATLRAENAQLTKEVAYVQAQAKDIAQKDHDQYVRLDARLIDIQAGIKGVTATISGQTGVILDAVAKLAAEDKLTSEGEAELIAAVQKALDGATLTIGGAK